MANNEPQMGAKNLFVEDNLNISNIATDVSIYEYM